MDDAVIQAQATCYKCLLSTLKAYLRIPNCPTRHLGRCHLIVLESAMIVTLRRGEDEVVAEDLGFRPIRAGQFLEAAIVRRGLTREEVCRRTGMTDKELGLLIDGSVRLDSSICNKLSKAFPETRQMLLRIQEENDYFETHGVARPSQSQVPIKSVGTPSATQ